MFLRNLFVLLLTVLVGSAVAFAQAEVYHAKIEIPDSLCLSEYVPDWAADVIDCVGEDICFTGSYTWNYTLVFDPSGIVHYRETVNDHALKGIGMTSGAKYRRVGADTYTYTGDGEPPIIEHFSQALHFIGSGSAPDLLMHAVWKVTINANAEVTVEREDFWMECK